MFHNVKQNSDEWDQLRAPRITSSALSKAMANYGKAFGEPAKKYAIQIAVSQLTGKVPPKGYTSEKMDRGHADEPLARRLYEDQYFCDVTNGGFFEIGDIGCSPDGLIGDDGIIEIKTADPSIHYSRIVRQSYDPIYKWQLIGNLKLIKRKWIDFVSYCPAYPEESQLYVYRCYPSMFKEEYGQIDIRLVEFRALIEQAKHNILNKDYSIIKEVA